MPQAKTADAVVIVPGIMGSELVDESGRVLWGLSPSVLTRAWLNGGTKALHVTADEMNGKRRVRATRLLRVPAYMPFLSGIEPYTDLVQRAQQSAVDPRALLEFPYDWRMPVESNAAMLFQACERHLQDWTGIVQAEYLGDPQDVRLVIVAHSMGGLLARHAGIALGLQEVLREVITLGTPYFGSVKALQMTSTGKDAPLPARAARALAITCPGVYDLLPRYRCVTDRGSGSLVLERLSTGHVASMGGDQYLAAESATWWPRLGLDGGDAHEMDAISTAVVGSEQPTLQSLHLNAGEPRFLSELDGIDYRGDGTVYVGAAKPPELKASALPQKHGALAKTPEALAMVAYRLAGAQVGPPLGTRPIGFGVPDHIRAGEPVAVRVYGTDGDPVGITVISGSLGATGSVRWHGARREGDAVIFSRTLQPGLHRIEAKAGGFSAVSEIILVGEPT